MPKHDASRIPVLASVGQSIERSEIVTSTDLATRAARAAFDLAPRLADRVDQLTAVAVSFSPILTAPASAVAKQLGLENTRCEVTTPGGHSPQWAVTRAAAAIAAGELTATLIVGAEATRSMRAGDSGADFLSALGRKEENEATPDPEVGVSTQGMVSDAEREGGLRRAAEVYPLFENALARAAGRSPAEQRTHLGRVLAPFTQVAARNPYAWFPATLDAAQISTPTQDNRITAEPYTKRMNSFPNVDFGSALFVCSLAAAREAGAASDCIYIWGGASNSDGPPSSRRNLGESRAIRAASGAMFANADIGSDDIAAFDLYSAFPSAFQVAAAEVGIDSLDPRGLTVTGGMSFFGGPGNNYSSHGIASMFDTLREKGGLGLVSANGGYLSKHSLGLYGTTPPPMGFREADTRAAQERIDADALPIVREASGEATVAGSTVVYARDGSVERAPVVATLDDGRRVFAHAEESLLPELAGLNLLDRKIRVRGSPSRYTL